MSSDQPFSQGDHGPLMTRDAPSFAEFTRTFLTGQNVMTEDKARSMAELLHDGQTDKSGQPYMEHIFAVLMNTQKTSEYSRLSPEAQASARIVALLHDSVEDTALTSEDLASAGCSAAEIEAINALTAHANEPRANYYERVKAAGAIAVAVKLGDLAHNADPRRRALLPGSPGVPVINTRDDTYSRLGKKYANAYVALGAAVPEHLKQFASTPSAQTRATL